MTRWVALLRGVNVGGITMRSADLAELFRDTLAPAPAYLSKVPRDLVALLSSRFGFEFAL